LHRYVELTSAPDIGVEDLYRLVCTDADLLHRYVSSLGCLVDPDAIKHGLRSLDRTMLHGLARAHTWAVAPLGGSARLGFDQWRSVLRTACFAEALARESTYAAGEAARLRTLLGISGLNIAHDPLMAEVVEFRGASAENLIDAHPLLRLFAVAEVLEHQSPEQAAQIAFTLFGLDATRFARLIAEADAAADALIEAAGIQDTFSDGWLERLWMQAQLTAMSNVLAREPTEDAVFNAANYATRGLFDQVPRCFVVDRLGTTLIASGDDDLKDLRIPIDKSQSALARAVRERRSIELEEAETLSVVDRQVMRRMNATRLNIVPMIEEHEAVGVLAFRLTDDDRGDAGVTMQGFASELGVWLTARRRETSGRVRLLTEYRSRQEKRLREVVHEANNPLSIIHNYLHILELRLKDQPATHEQLRMIGEEIRRAGEIIRRVVEMPQIDTVRDTTQPTQAERFDLNEVARTVLELILGQVQGAGIQVHQLLHPGGVEVLSDRARVMQIVTNLVRNAVEAMPEGGALTVETMAGVYRAGRAGAEIMIRDDGPGLPQDVVAALYAPKQSTKGGDHSGLGLHITARLVDELGGAIDARTAPGRGTQFSVFLPNVR
jgi:signal transduction histidine kinase